jgi:UDP-N-acetylmuramoyl-L-alanyl-D-glutamate--2,6-diaminopimelate ligase
VKTFAELLRDVPAVARGGPPDKPVDRLVTDSRRAGPGSLFVALKGQRHDGHAFIAEALERGAVAVVSDRPIGELPHGTAWAQVAGAADAVWRIARVMYDDPSASLRLIGVTGTNGKTTTAHLIRTILDETGRCCALIGTLGAELGDRRLGFGHTTPMAHDLAYVMAEALREGCDAACMEVSSHALALKRVEGCRFDACTYTNLTPEHLDFHENMEDYYAAKARLFGELAEQGGKPFTGVVNVEDPYGRRLAAEVRGRAVLYGRGDGDVRASEAEVAADSVRFLLETPDGAAMVRMPLGGRFNVSNGLAAAATAWALGISAERIAEALEHATPTPGRFEGVPTGRDFSVIVDYAHTPDALAKLLEACRDLAPSRLTVVFGCGGDRDATKRPTMGAIAAELCDRVVVTSDNPRSEDPDAIIDQILGGIGASVREWALVEPDRRQAIHKAVHSAQPGELVVIAGKGHEDYQILGERRIHFDDREVVREALQ